MDDNGNSKDDVRMPDGEVGDKITKLFKTEEKDTSKPPPELDTIPGYNKLTTPSDVTVQTAMGEEAAIDAKESPK